MSARKKLEAEVDVVKNQYAGSSVVKKVGWDYSERQLTISVMADGKTLRFNFYIPDDYPSDKPLCTIDDDRDDLSDALNNVNEFCQSKSSNLPSIVARLLKEIAPVLKIEVPVPAATDATPAPAAAPSLTESSTDLRESASIPNDDDFDEYDDDRMNELKPFVKDCNATIGFFGAKFVMVYPFIDTVRLGFDTTFMNAEAKRVLGVKSPMVVLSVEFTPEYTQNRTAPKVKAIFQNDQDKSGLGEQLENVARKYLERRWSLLYGQHEPLLKKLQDTTGFETDDCVTALIENNNEIERATAWLYDEFGSDKSASKTQGASPAAPGGGFLGNLLGSGKSKKNQPATTPSASQPTVTAAERQAETVQQIKQAFKSGWLQLGVGLALQLCNQRLGAAVKTILECGGEKFEDLRKLKSQYSNPADDTRSKNFVLELMSYLSRRASECMGYCLVCDEKIVATGYEGFDIKETPIICTMGTCQFNYIELGAFQSVPIGICPSSLSNDIVNNPDVVDLLISMCVSAATSSRRDSIFLPFPPEYEKGGNKNYGQVESVLNMFPSVEDMRKHCDNETTLIGYLSKQDPSGQAYKLLRWILTVNRSVLLKIPPKNQISVMGTPHQYIMPSGTDPERTAKFREMRKVYGSYFAFHGSGIENWHSILRRGLLNCSGTKLMTTGAAYGPGVYLAPDSGTSMGYARTGKAWTKSRFGDSSNLLCLAIAEVVKHPEVPQSPNPYYVIRSADMVATRFFCFYPGGNSGLSVQASSLSLHQYV